ncbi:MAG TPA: tRNA uridine-5-carboxymethylaminomethyl(34) synthesis enzyme MnmG, partial [Phycisphaerales bacterium]|nr:tRNA uridine-5-carboxymethylaminomethyl(34) synthesis enzyme MnmG [Phycisphaerales bacterium]
LDPSKIGEMSCNPAIGGLAKGQLVREIDAMGGLMGLLADATGIHFKVLNTSKGPAVHGPRCQSDKVAYAEAARAAIASRPEIEVIGGAVETLRVRGGRITGVGVRTPAGDVVLEADAVVLTTGTFMRGLMHVGDTKSPGGRFGEAAAGPISDALHALGFELGRLKTGTPPRLRRGSIDWESLPEHPGDDQPRPFSDLSVDHGGNPSLTLGAPFRELSERFPVLEQVDCRRTHTTPGAHEIIRENLHRAPLFTGQIDGAGPRYCPSIEDKVVRFAGRDSHGVYLEPESLRTDWVYCNGISSSLPADVQDAIVRTMPGCERAEILRYGYAVEYDMVRPHQIRATCETHAVGGLFLAGQINGTSGYEEAAAQGLIAGINAARLARGEAADFTLGRDEAYIGVLMDDLVTKTPVEPYRMFTSRAEHRLLLRADNAADRLTPVARRLGLLEHTSIGRLRSSRFDERTAQRGALMREIEHARLGGVPLREALMKNGFGVSDLRAAMTDARAEDVVWETVLADLRYEPYVRRQHAEVRRQAVMDERRIPQDLIFSEVVGLRSEAREALETFRPETFGQAGRLEGVTPADLTLLAVHARKSRRG